MKIKGYVLSAAALIFLVYLAYYVNFFTILGGVVSKDPGVWGQFGDYVGGVLNPLLSFVSIVLLIKSLVLQHDANNSLKADIKNNEKTEQLRSFEVLFFNLINAQKELFDSFNICVSTANGSAACFTGVKAVIKIEDRIEALKGEGATNRQIAEYLNSIDETDQIFGLSRAFYIMVMIITDRLSDARGFSVEDRKIHFKALVNLTDFAQLRIIMICVQFLRYESTKYLRASLEFKNVIEELGLKYELY